MSTKEKMEEARELIRAARYNEARNILQTIDHPMAQEWLHKLDKIAPDTRKQNAYADSIEKEHPYEPNASEESGWARSIKTVNTTLEDAYEARVEQVKVRIVKKQQKAMLYGLFSFVGLLIGIALVVNIFLEAEHGNFRPIVYWVGFMGFGLPMRIVFRAGREGEDRLGVIAGIVLGIVTLIAMIVAEYGFYLRSLHIYELVFSGSYFAAYVRNASSSISFQGMLLFAYAYMGVALVVFPTDAEFSKAIEAMLKGRRVHYYRG